uniref:Glutamyl-tRNA(Gln) amidotransferase subunit C, mitochondrial n=1 Tax=Anopheles dirus TaxID=7168 RepID=A0A182N1E2_9DIPT
MLRRIVSRASVVPNRSYCVTSPSTSSGRWAEKRLQHRTKVPQQPSAGGLLGSGAATKTTIDQQTVRLLERLSLVDLDSSEALATLQDSIEFASRILLIETDGVQPLYCVLEQQQLALRADTVDDGDLQEEVLRNASLTEEEYFVAPPGNIPLEQTRAVAMARPARTFLDLLQACQRSQFVDFTIRETRLRDLRFTDVGAMLRENLRTEWHRPGSIPIFPGRHDLSTLQNYDTVRARFATARPPLGIATEATARDRRVHVGDRYALELAEGGVELCTTYLPPPSTTANQFLYQLQRQRKIWWMRLAADPGRFFISDWRQTGAGDGSATVVSIGARFADAEVELERLELVDGSGPDSVVRVRHDLERAVFGVLLDALDCTPPLERCVKIHRKIAPYKCGIVCGTAETDLSELSNHLAGVLRAANLSVRECMQKDDQSDASQQLAQLDRIGVPYALLLHSHTLRTGLLQLRSRDTTLAETIHITDLPHYLAKIIKHA